MIDHVSIGVADVAKAKRFYDAVLKPLGYNCLSESVGPLGYGRHEPAFWVVAAKHPVPQNPGSGLHVCFAAPTRASVEAFHAAALAQGGRDNGTPGVRTDYGPNYFAAFAIDPDGYRIEAHCEAS